MAFSRLEDGTLNSRGFSNPWNTSRFNYRTVCKIAIKREQRQACLGYAEREQFGRSQNGDFQYRWAFKPSETLPFRIFTDAIFIFPFVPTDLSPRLFAFGFASCQTPFLCVSYLTLGGFDCALCLMFSFWFAFRCFANGQWLTANGCCFVVWNSATKIHLYFDITK